MTYLDRDYNDVDSGGRGGMSRFFSRVVENPENPLGWSVKMFTFDGIVVRIHLVTIVYFLAMMLSSIAWSNIGIGYMSIAMGSLFLVVLLHEFGHCYAARWVGGSADRIVMLPFGGLALCNTPHEPRAYFLTAAGGPMVNLLIFPLTSIGLLLIGRPDAIITFNPFVPGAVISSFQSTSTIATYGMITLWWFHFTNIVIFAFNVFLPIFPLDGGRLLQGFLWRRRGYVRATSIAVTLGLVGSVVLFVFAAVTAQTLLMAIALFGGFACWTERKRLFADEELAAAGYAYAGDEYVSSHEPEAEAGPSKAEIKREERAEQEQEELDRVLAKISESGMESLSRKERTLLSRMTKKKRGE